MIMNQYKDLKLIKNDKITQESLYQELLKKTK